MRANSAQALSHTLTLLLAVAGAVGHGVFLAALLEFDNPGPAAIASGALIGWLVVLILYLIATMLAPKNSRFIWTITDVCVLLTFAAAGAAGTVYLAIVNWAHLDHCHHRLGSACEASIAGGAVSCVVVIALLASAITEAWYISKHHGKEGWYLSLRWIGQNTAQAEQLKPLMYTTQPPMAPRPRQGTFIPLVVAAVRRSKEYEDLPLVSPSSGSAPLRIMNRTSSDTVRRSAETVRASTDTLRSFHTARPPSSRRRSGSGSSITSVFSRKRTPSVFSHSSRRSSEEAATPLVGAMELPDDPFARSPRRLSDRVEELDDAVSLRSVPVNPQTRKRAGVALNAWPWRPESPTSDTVGTAV
ncbi:hypothetical protein CC85DRAFT_319319 [Cutaneotrichosporon oleaginosum]|uniref:MARVEL domain-containing protein n=1 Tax=Cutaneotrichosporon oleaginosum TaxID=879819 RepID=A0A0J0XLF8_9TREE|nr:uncharacterized protein CC85DRAFT_319319 [Cutaneotrichosporon oleaginosum]KLT41920.1 hypothetical protein CC85DRAFT_319319 [Cutaneotrichosporon oleaginosum]TXT12520.1 hypothetical protein COLE_02930 [Cutaneotrichosporon oleaginosum]